MCSRQLLSHRILLIAMRDVGLHVWETDSIISASKRDYILVTAPLATLAARAEMLEMKVRVKPKANGMFQVRTGAARGTRVAWSHRCAVVDLRRPAHARSGQLCEAQLHARRADASVSRGHPQEPAPVPRLLR